MIDPHAQGQPRSFHLRTLTAGPALLLCAAMALLFYFAWRGSGSPSDLVLWISSAAFVLAIVALFAWLGTKTLLTVDRSGLSTPRHHFAWAQVGTVRTTSFLWLKTLSIDAGNQRFVLPELREMPPDGVAALIEEYKKLFGA